MDRLLKRCEAADEITISPRQFDRIRKTYHFTEVNVTEGRKGLRFLYSEIVNYINAHKKWART